jgi:hypothetical protein
MEQSRVAVWSKLHMFLTIQNTGVGLDHSEGIYCVCDFCVVFYMGGGHVMH